jgi:hypothetical protein
MVNSVNGEEKGFHNPWQPPLPLKNMLPSELPNFTWARLSSVYGVEAPPSQVPYKPSCVRGFSAGVKPLNANEKYSKLSYIMKTRIYFFAKRERLLKVDR